MNLCFSKDSEVLPLIIQQRYTLLLQKVNTLASNKRKIPVNIDILLYIYIKFNSSVFNFGSKFPTSGQLKNYSLGVLGLLLYLPEHFKLSPIIFAKLLNVRKLYKVSLVKINYQVILNDLVRLQGLFMFPGIYYNPDTLYFNIQKRSFTRVYIDMFVLYTKLFDANIINFKKKPVSKCDLLFLTDYQIILYFRTISLGLLFYYRCVDNLNKVYAVINYYFRLSLIWSADL